jgi:Asp/Glu/hydantoin racemase
LKGTQNRTPHGPRVTLAKELWKSVKKRTNSCQNCPENEVGIIWSLEATRNLFPNISASVSELIDAEAKRSASANTAIQTVTAAFGVAYIETRFEALIGAYAAAQLAGEHAGNYDAVVVAAFGDPGLPGLKEVLPCPVVGLTQAALASACLLGNRISIVAISRRIRAWYQETVDSYGLGSRLVSIRSLDEPLPNIGSVQEDKAASLLATANLCVSEDGADVIILAGAPLAGLARSLSGKLPVPVVDGVSSAVRHAETLIRLNAGQATTGSFSPPPQKPNAGLPTSLQNLLTNGHQRLQSNLKDAS